MRLTTLMLLTAAQPAAAAITTLDCLAPHTPLLRAGHFSLEPRGDAWSAAVELTNPGVRPMAVTLSQDLAGTQHFTRHALAPGETRRLDAGAIPRARWFAALPPTPEMLREATVVSCGPAELR
jgi:hypothetical protein